VINLAAKVAKAHEFWQSIQEAPKEVSDIIVDLKLLSSVLTRIAHTEQQNEDQPDQIIVDALKSCSEKVGSLRLLMDEFEAGFQLDNKIKKKWSACKVVLKEEKLRKLRASLTETKATLALAQAHVQRWVG
jgi:hypothetical protein